MIGEDNTRAFFRFENDMIVLTGATPVLGHLVGKTAGPCSNPGQMYGEPARHPHVHDQRFAAIEVEKQVFCPPSQNLYLTAHKPGREVLGQRDAQISASSFRAYEAAA
jgi:hypothetical protein